MAEQEVILTAEGKKKLEEELAWREGEHLKEINEAIKTAKDFGDLSENAEYDAAKEDQAKNTARIAEINTILANAKVAKKSSKASTVSVGSVVTLTPKGAKKSVAYTIVGTTETDSRNNKISNESPLGSVLMGQKAGATVQFVAPNKKKREFVIDKIN